MSISQNLQQIKNTIPNHVTLVAVSKTKPIEAIQEAYNAGQRVFGENKVQEMAEKFTALPKDIEWHMIGHLQKNKVKYMAEFVSLIHGVDDFDTLKEINKQAKKWRRTIHCLLQVKIAKEDSKFGMSPKEVIDILSSEPFLALENIKVVGLMGMATFTEDTNTIHQEFQTLQNLYQSLQQQYQFTTLSMGMSDDYELAIKNGSNMVRIGSAIFGDRNYL